MKLTMHTSFSIILAVAILGFMLSGCGDGDAIEDQHDITSPIVSIVSPADGSTVPRDLVTLLAMATDDDRVTEVEFFVDGASKGRDASSSYSTGWDASSLDAGSAHTILAMASDAAGNVGYSQTITVVVGATASADTNPPTVSIVSPADGSTVPRDLVALLAMATDDVDVAEVEFFVDGASKGSDASSPYSVDWNATSLPSGSAHTILAIARDAAGNVGYSQNVTVVVGATASADTNPPTVSIVSPADGSTVPRDLVALLAMATDDVDVAEVEFFIDGASKGSDASSPYSVDWDATSLPAGSAHTILAIARDAAGNVGYSQNVTVVVGATASADTNPPTVSIVSPADGSTVPRDYVALLAMATDDVDVTEVEFFVDGASKGSDAWSPYSVDWDAISLPAGSAHTILAVAKDAAGNVGYSQNVTVVVGATASADTNPPTVSIVSPADGSTVPRDHVALLAMATDDVDVTEVEFFVDGASKGSDASTPYSVDWDARSLGVGSAHAILAVAKDAAGNVGYSQNVTVVVGECPCGDGYYCDGSGQCQAWSLTWVRLSAGTFAMGSGIADEQPVHQVSVPAFDMTMTEVTVAKYQACVDAGACFAPDTCGWGSPNWGVAGREDHPVNCVDWQQANDFCGFVGGRLPSEAEWEYAARGGGQDITYPWGDAPASCTYAVMYGGGAGCGMDSTWAVCGKPAGNTAQGLCDMAGNAYEWVQDWHHGDYNGAPSDGGAWESPSGSFRVRRGGGFSSDASALRAANRFPEDPSYRRDYVGFRCARDAP